VYGSLVTTGDRLHIIMWGEEWIGGGGGGVYEKGWEGISREGRGLGVGHRVTDRGTGVGH
jgi:hypothetical protein